MTITQSIETTLAELQARLVAHLQDGAIDLTDDLLGLSLLAGVLHTPALTVRTAQLDLSEAGAVAVRGTADLLGASDVTLSLRIAPAGRT